MLNSFEQGVNFVISNGILNEFKARIVAIQQETIQQKWKIRYEFETILDKIDI
ncbi:hypothetical protein D3C84_1214040 [compost metagenome]